MANAIAVGRQPLIGNRFSERQLASSSNTRKGEIEHMMSCTKLRVLVATRQNAIILGLQEGVNHRLTITLELVLKS